MVVRKGFQDVIFNCTANVPFSQNILGDAFEVFYATGKIQIQFDDGPAITSEQTCGNDVQEYNKVTVISPINQVVTLKLGSGGITDNRLSLTIGALTVAMSVPATCVSDVDVAVPATSAVQILAFDANRRRAKIMVPQTAGNTIRIGGAATNATHGVEYQPGTGDDFETTAAIFAYNSGAAPINLQITTFGV